MVFGGVCGWAHFTPADVSESDVARTFARRRRDHTRHIQSRFQVIRPPNRDAYHADHGGAIPEWQARGVIGGLPSPPGQGKGRH